MSTVIGIDVCRAGRIITQILDNQFINSDITLKEIQLAKKILKEKLNNIYHLRIEYPD